VTSPTVLLITKLIAAKERGLERRSAKGMKDLTDIFALLQVQLDAVNWEVVRKHVSSESIEAVLAAALGDYGLIKRSFPALSFTEFKQIRKRLKEENLI
jgi:negative regulator of sigma E activity